MIFTEGKMQYLTYSSETVSSTSDLLPVQCANHGESREKKPKTHSATHNTKSQGHIFHPHTTNTSVWTQCESQIAISITYHSKHTSKMANFCCLLQQQENQDLSNELMRHDPTPQLTSVQHPVFISEEKQTQKRLPLKRDGPKQCGK